MVVRELPLDLAAALPLALGAGEEVELRGARRRAQRPARPDRRGRRPRGLDRRRAVDGKRRSGTPASFVDPGEHRLRVRSTSDRTVLASVGLVAAAQLATTPLPEIPAATLAALPAFPRLAATSAQTLDLAAGEARTFLVAADEPALYRFESTGLLATAGSLRTRTRANLLAAGGRTASAGTSRSPPTCARATTSSPCGRAARAPDISDSSWRARRSRRRGALAAGHPGAGHDRSAAAPSPIAGRSPKAGATHVSPGVCADRFAVRLEDADGWPVAAPLAERRARRRSRAGRLPADRPAAGGAGAGGRPRDRGSGRRASSPATVRTRSLSTREAANLWLEPAEGAPRDPDRWRFTLPARTGVTITLSDEMMGAIRAARRWRSGSRAARRRAGAARAELPRRARGRRVRARRRSRRAATTGCRYRVAVRTDDLVDGGVRERPRRRARSRSRSAPRRRRSSSPRSDAATCAPR